MKVTSSKKVVILLASVSAAALFALPARGQTGAVPAAKQATEPEPTQADAASDPADIVVTAQKRLQSINDVGVSITAATGEQLQARGVTDVTQLVKVVPGFNFNQTAQGSPVYSIRGVGYQDTSIASSPAVTVYVDEVPVPYSGATLGAALDVEHVEVLKGPQGTLFGGNSTGGAINYVAAKPTNTLKAGVNWEFGRFATSNLTGFVSGPLSDTFKVRLAGRWLRGGPWQKSVSRDDEIGRQDQLFGRLIAEWQPVDRLTVSINVNGWRDRSESQAPQLVVRTPAAPQPLDPVFLAAPFILSGSRRADWTASNDYRHHSDYWQTSGRIDYEIADGISLSSITSYQEYKRYVPVDLDGTPSQTFYFVSSGKVDTFFQELRTLFDLNGRGNVTLGVNYQSDKIRERGFLDFSRSSQAFLGGTIAPTYDQKVETKAVFGSIEYEVVPRLSVIAGGRYTGNDRDFSGCSRDTGNGAAASAFNAALGGIGAVPGGCLTLAPNGRAALFTDTFDQTNFSWKAGLNYKPDRDLLIYGSVSRGYKSGAYQSLSAVTSDQLAPVVQESLLAYEVGVKSRVSSSLQLNAAAYYYDYSDKQIRGVISAPLFGNLEALINVPKSRIVGFELSAILRPIEGITVTPGVTLVDSKVRSDLIGLSPAGVIGNFRGQAFPYTPRWSGNVDVEYRWGLGGTLHSFVGANLSYQTSANGGFGEDPDYRIRGYALVDLRAGVESASGNWNAGIFARNVTNQYYWITATRASDAGTRFAGLPATYGLSLGFRY